MMKRNRSIATILILLLCLTSFHTAIAKVKKEDLKKVAIAAVVLPVLSPPKAQEKPKAPKAPKAEVPKVEIPGLPKEETPKNKKEAKEAQKQKESQAKDAADETLAIIGEMAAAGDMQAQYILGYAYYTGQEVEESNEQALVWWQKANKQGHREADAYIGLSFAEGFGGSLQNQDEAVRRYKRAAASGSPFAELLLGIYDYQFDTAESKLSGAAHFRAAADKGNPMAKAFLEIIFKKGIDAKQDFGRNIDWKKEAKKLPLLELYTQAGINAFKGQIAEQSYEAAVKWWELSTAMGDEKARALLGTAYYTGRGIGQDYTKAIELLKLAAAKGEPLAEYTLGKAYYEGNGVQKNNDKARELFRAAGSRGIAESKKMADKLEGRA